MHFSLSVGALLPFVAAADPSEETRAESGEASEEDEGVKRHVHVCTQDREVTQWRKDHYTNDVQCR